MLHATIRCPNGHIISRPLPIDEALRQAAQFGDCYVYTHCWVIPFDRDGNRGEMFSR